MKFPSYMCIVLCAISVMTMGAGCSENKASSYTPAYQAAQYEEEKTISRDDALSEHWREISRFVDGTEEVEAYSEESGNSYDLEADIASGTLETLYFENGGELSFSAEFDSDGTASDTDEDYNNWDFTLDTSSSIVDDAVQSWAEDNGYTVD